MAASPEVQSHMVEGEVGETKGPFHFGFKIYTYLPEFSLKIQLCMYTYMLFKGFGNNISRSVLEQPLVLDKLSICIHQCIKILRDAQVGPSILRVVVAFLFHYSSGTGKKVGDLRSVFTAFRMMKTVVSSAFPFCMFGYVVFLGYNTNTVTELCQCIT